ncbi:glycoside hydrolase family 19 protein [Acinetobacter bereziniae]|jgi:hypothetical protein|uniref:glycoside hydrolase family 19 protein n=2 Tax=Acinetobacter bereziniae TaxID=106648 RepID=UPI001250A597|nr:hypothetical protein [Acinetobacter bereziniae]MCU4415701.1 hypothetical protein [Acinetobacter bereziniae]MCV2444059.1 hypothetical protein [Acinetobacter bereziniae]
MSELTTIVAKFFDSSGKYIINLDVKSRYLGSSKDNTRKTDNKGFFVFQASRSRTIEILAKPPNQQRYIIFKTINSSIESSENNPVVVLLPKTIDDYKKVNNSLSKGIVSTLFKVVDSNGRIMVNFPIQSRPKGKNNSPDKYTNNQGIVEVLSSSNRDIEILVLNSRDQFELKFSGNSGNGTKQPILIRLNEKYSSFKGTTLIKVLDKSGQHYAVDDVDVEMIFDNNQKKNLKIKKGQLKLSNWVGQKIKLTIFKPDGNPLDSVDFMVRRVKEEFIDLQLNVDVLNGRTALNEPNISRRIEDSISGEIISLSFFKEVYGAKKLFWRNEMNGRPTKDTTPEQFLPVLNKVLLKYNMTEKLILCHFLAQIYHECDHFNTLIEYASGKDYDISNFPQSVCEVQKSRACRRRKQIISEGNTTPGDGPKYKGRGLIQLTWKSAYIKYKNYSGLDVVTNSDLLCNDLSHAVESAVWAFNEFKNADTLVRNGYTDLDATYTDSHHLDVVDKVSRRINGGINGLAERKKLFFKILREVEKRNGFK